MANEVKTVLTADVSGFTSDMIKAEKSTTEFGNSMTKAGSKSNTLKGALRQATKEAMDLSLQMSKMSQTELDSDIGRELQAQFQQALQAAGNFKDQMEDVNREIKNIASDTAGWDAAKEGIGVLSSSMQGLAGVVGLCGGDVNAFTKALTTMNTIQQVVNTVITIGNALQKESALMTNLRAVGTRLLAKATTEATTAQLANNAAVLSNPYVLAAAAIAALCAGIYAWVNANNDLTDSEREKGEAMAAVAEQMDKQADKLATQISAFKILQTEYEKNGHSLNEMKKNMTNFDDVCKNANITLKDQATAEKVLGNLAPVMIAKYRAEAKAAAGAAAMQAEYGRIMAKVADIQKRLAEGKTIDVGDLEELNLKVDYSSLNKLGLAHEHGVDDLIASWLQPSAVDIKMAAGKTADEVADAIIAAAYDAFENGDKFDYYTKQIEDGYTEMAAAVKKFQESGVDTGTLFGNAEKQIKKTSKTSKEAVRETLNSLEGCDAIIQRAEKDMKKLDKTTGDYANKVAALKQTIITARVAKLNLLDKSTPAGLLEARRLIEQIMQELPGGSKTLEEMRGELQKCDEQLYNMLNEVAKNGSLGDLRAVRSQIDKIIETLPVGSEELEKWAAKWGEINGKIKSAERAINNAKEGEEVTPAKLKQLIREKEDELNHTTDLNIREGINLDIDKLRKQLANIENKWAYEYSKDIMIFVDLETEFDENGTPYPKEVKRPYAKQDDYFYRDSQLQQDEKALDKLENRVKWLQEQIAHPEDVPDWGLGKVKEELDILTPALEEWRDIVKFNTITEDIKNFNKELGKTSYDNFKQGIDVMSTLYDSIANLPDKLDECEDGFEGFFAVMSAVFSLVDGIVSFIEGIEKMTEVIQMLTGAKEALTKVQIGETAANTAGTISNETAAAAEEQKMAADIAAEGASAAKVAALKAEEAALLDMASAQIFAAHAYIPFAGVGIASGFVAAMMGEMTAVHAASAGMQALAEGGIVQGSTTVGDQVYARLNAGEMVLNRGQQARLFRMINTGVIGNGTNSNELTGTVRVKGSDLYMSLNNYNKITGKKV